MAIEYDHIIIRGTGIRATKLMEEIESWRKCDFSLYEEVKGKLRCFVDSDASKRGTRLYGMPVITPEENCRDVFDSDLKSDIGDVTALSAGTVLYIVSIANSKPIIDEIKKDNDSHIMVISDRDFLLKMHGIMANDGYKVYNEEDAFPLREVKALFFLHADQVLERKVSVNISAPNSTTLEKGHGTIAMFTTTYGGGGAERVIARLGEILGKNGHKVIIVAERLGEHQYAVPENAQCIYTEYSYSEDFYAWVEERYKLLKAHHVQVACFHIPYEGSMLFYEVLLCKLMGIKTIVEAHTSFINALVQRGGLRENKTIYILADKLVVLSKTDETFWRDRGVDAVYIPNPVFIEKTDNYSNTAREKNTLLWIGKIDQKYKRVLDLVPIIKKVKENIPNIRLYVVGATIDTDVAGRLKQLIFDSHLEENIILCGYLDEVQSYYQRTSVMLMTSPGEGFPMVLAEAKSQGVPTVMYDLPYLELVKDKRGVSTVKKGDITGFANEIVSILRDDEKRKTLSAAAMGSAKSFNSYDVAGAWRDVFEGKEKKLLDENAMIKDRALTWKLLDELTYRSDVAKRHEEISELDMEERRALQKKYGFIDWHLTPKIDKPYIESIVNGIKTLSDRDHTVKTIVEVGCGLGDIIGDPLLDDFIRTGLDLNQEVIAAAEERYFERGIEWISGSFNDVQDREIGCLIAVNFIHSIKPEYLIEYFRNIFGRNTIRYLFVDLVTGNYPYTHDFNTLLPAGLHEISRFGPYGLDGGTQHILLFENYEVTSHK